jgi:hypothetical protein
METLNIKNDTLISINAKGVDTIIIPDCVKFIGSNCFTNAPNITHVKLSCNTMAIFEEAFFGSNITSIEIPASVRIIFERAFVNCIELKHVIFNSGIEIIADRAFLNSGIEELNLPSSIQGIGNFAFGKCENLRCCTIQRESRNHSISLSLTAFNGCDNLFRINI